MKNDNVNHPAHYNHDGIETIDVIKAWTKDLKPFEAYCMGNAIKYVSRWKDKGGIEDLKKARWYLNRVIGDENKEAVPEWSQKMKDCLEKHAEQTNQIDESRWIKVDSEPLCEDIWAQFFKGIDKAYRKDLDDGFYIRLRGRVPKEKNSEDKKEDEWWKQFFLGTCRDYTNDLEDSHYIRGLGDCIPKEKDAETKTLDKSTAIKAFRKNELSIVFTADDNVAIVDKMLDCIKYLDVDGCRREHLILELIGYLPKHPTAWKNKWSIVISLAGCRPDGKWIDICVAQDDFRNCPTIDDKPYYIWPSEVD